MFLLHRHNDESKIAVFRCGRGSFEMNAQLILSLIWQRMIQLGILDGAYSHEIRRVFVRLELS